MEFKSSILLSVEQKMRFTFIQRMSVESNAALDFIDFHCMVKTEHSSEHFILCSTEKKKVKKI